MGTPSPPLDGLNGSGRSPVQDPPLPCRRQRTCRSCNEQWPECAWCASSSTCLAASSELRAVAGRHPDVDVILSSDVHSELYDEPGANPVVNDSLCDVRLTTPSACMRVRHWCMQFSHCSTCIRRRGCGYCHYGGSSGRSGRCSAGVPSGELGMRKGPRESCGEPRGRPAREVGAWLYGDWNRPSGDLEERQRGCVEHCAAGPVRLDAASGEVRMGDLYRNISYAHGSECTWSLRPPNWHERMELFLYLRFNRVARRGDMLSVSQAGQELVSVGHCRQDTGGCTDTQNVVIKGPVLIAFRSVLSGGGDGSRVGAWAISWRWAEAAAPDESSTVSPNLLWVVVGLVLAMLVPCVVALLVAKCRQRFLAARGGGAQAAGTAGPGARQLNQQVPGRGVDLAACERDFPSCRPAVLGRNLEEACSVCLADLAPGDEVRRMRCRHVFHRSCIDAWLTQHALCPVCREPVRPQRADQPPTCQTPDDLFL